MLTRDLILCRRRNGRWYPAFADPADPAALDTAARLLAIYDEAAADHLCRSEIAELAAGVPAGSGNAAKLRGGLLKILDDNGEFAAAGEVDYPLRRKRIFLAAAAQLKEASGDPAAYRAAVARETGFADLDAVDPFGDLPDFERLRGRKRSFTAESLLRHYDLVLVQSLVVFAEKVVFELPELDAAVLRQLLRLVRFHRLLALGKRDAAGGIRLEVSGPFALFGATRKYALQLANFLPAVLTLPRWKLRAELTVGAHSGELLLDESSGVAADRRGLGSYVPEEIRLFGRAFRDRAAGKWEPVADAPLFPAGSGALAVPDFSFRRVGGGEVRHLELFHRWHRGELESRIAFLAEHPGFPLLLGIDRALADGEELEKLCAGRPAVAGRCFLFRDFPGVETVLKKLEAPLG